MWVIHLRADHVQHRHAYLRRSIPVFGPCEGRPTLLTIQLARKLPLALTCSIAFAIGAPAAAFAQTNPTTGQPGTTAGFNCGTSIAPVEPGNAANALGSAFNETSPGTAGTVYAGNGPGSVNHAGSTAAVSQYDAACRQLSSH